MIRKTHCFGRQGHQVHVWARRLTVWSSQWGSEWRGKHNEGLLKIFAACAYHERGEVFTLHVDNAPDLLTFRLTIQTLNSKPNKSILKILFWNWEWPHKGKRKYFRDMSIALKKIRRHKQTGFISDISQPEWSMALAYSNLSCMWYKSCIEKLIFFLILNSILQTSLVMWNAASNDTPDQLAWR